jgi:hypothetical protein
LYAILTSPTQTIYSTHLNLTIKIRCGNKYRHNIKCSTLLFWRTVICPLFHKMINSFYIKRDITHHRNGVTIRFPCSVNATTRVDKCIHRYHQWLRNSASSWSCPAFARSNTGIVGSNTTEGMDVYLHLSCVCVGSGLEMGWSPVQAVLPTVFGLRNWSETKRFKDALRSKVGVTGKRERERQVILPTWSLLNNQPHFTLRVIRPVIFQLSLSDQD